jgi:hypothetical protein
VTDWVNAHLAGKDPGAIMPDAAEAPKPPETETVDLVAALRVEVAALRASEVGYTQADWYAEALRASKQQPRPVDSRPDGAEVR